MSRSLRLPAALFTLLCLLVAGVVPVLHAMGEDAAPTAQAHLHAADGTGDCPAPHDALHCPACKAAGQKLDASPSAARRTVDALRRTASSLPSRQADPSAAPASQPGSRAPPRG